MNVGTTTLFELGRNYTSLPFPDQIHQLQQSGMLRTVGEWLRYGRSISKNVQTYSYGAKRFCDETGCAVVWFMDDSVLVYLKKEGKVRAAGKSHIRDILPRMEHFQRCEDSKCLVPG